MTYIAKENRKESTYLFPGKHGKQYCAKSFQREVRFLLTDILKKNTTDTNIFDTHVWHKTAYAVALVGKF